MAEVRQMLQNDSVMARHLDGDDDYNSDRDPDESARSSVLSTDSETLTNGSYPSGATTAEVPTATSRNAYNTGPKGVRSDARAFQTSQSQQQTDKRAAEAARVATIGQAKTWAQTQSEDDARERWVEKRLKELSKSRAAGAGSGVFEQVDAGRYLELVESHRHVCVLITPPPNRQETRDDDDGRDASGVRARDPDEVAEFLQLLPGVMAKYRALTCVSLTSEEAEVDAVACPALLLYRDGELVGNHMRVLDGLRGSEDVTTGSVTRALSRLGILQEAFCTDSLY